MKMSYISPEAKFLRIDAECLVANSGVAIDNGSCVNNGVPEENTDDNFFSNVRSTGIIWDE